MGYLYINSVPRNAPEPYPGPKRNVRLYDDSRTSDLASNLRPPTGDGRDRAEAKRRQEKEAAAGASA